jgi:hypothetical protein
MKSILSVLFLATGLGLVAGCATVGDGTEPQTGANANSRPPPDIGRDAALYATAIDAQTRFGIVGLTPVMASRTGDVWVVDMSSADGASVHYAIGATDGSVRERRVRR